MWEVSDRQLESYNSNKFDFSNIGIGDRIVVEVKSVQNFYKKTVIKGEVIHLKKGRHFTIKAKNDYGILENETVMRCKILCNDVKILYHEKV